LENLPMTARFSTEHAWVDPADPNAAVVGITVHAQEALGDVVFVDLPEIGRAIDAGAVAGVVESVKAAADVFMPASGVVVEVNEALRADPSLANSDPLGQGWFFKVRLMDSSQVDSLLDSAAYEALLRTL
jgi:glycine cleavage system H protein